MCGDTWLWMIQVALPVDHTTHSSRTADTALKQGKGFLFHPYPRHIFCKVCQWDFDLKKLWLLDNILVLIRFINKERHLLFHWICHLNFVWDLRGTVTKQLTLFGHRQDVGTFHTPQHFPIYFCNSYLVISTDYINLIELILLLFV